MLHYLRKKMLHNSAPVCNTLYSLHLLTAIVNLFVVFFSFETWLNLIGSYTQKNAEKPKFSRKNDRFINPPRISPKHRLNVSVTELQKEVGVLQLLIRKSSLHISICFKQDLLNYSFSGDTHFILMWADGGNSGVSNGLCVYVSVSVCVPQDSHIKAY